jgi:hypothetical protein
LDVAPATRSDAAEYELFEDNRGTACELLTSEVVQKTTS